MDGVNAFEQVFVIIFAIFFLGIPTFVYFYFVGLISPKVTAWIRRSSVTGINGVGLQDSQANSLSSSRRMSLMELPKKGGAKASNKVAPANSSTPGSQISSSPFANTGPMSQPLSSSPSFSSSAQNQPQQMSYHGETGSLYTGGIRASTPSRQPFGGIAGPPSSNKPATLQGRMDSSTSSNTNYQLQFAFTPSRDNSNMSLASTATESTRKSFAVNPPSIYAQSNYHHMQRNMGLRQSQASIISRASVNPSNPASMLPPPPQRILVKPKDEDYQQHRTEENQRQHILQQHHQSSSTAHRFYHQSSTPLTQFRQQPQQHQPGLQNALPDSSDKAGSPNHGNDQLPPLPASSIPNHSFHQYSSVHRPPNATRLPHSASIMSTATAASTTRLIHDAPEAYLAFKDIRYSVTMKRKRRDLLSHIPFVKGGASSTFEKEILKGVSGCMKPGTLTAIMGPSGCGKTTLLDILAGRKYSGNIQGQISLNGKARDLETFKRISAYVMQNDCLFSFLTVKEILMYAADLRIAPNEISQEDKLKRVDRVMRDLDLIQLANTRIGDESVPGGLSRGQKRRVSVAIELLTFPSLLFLDEPTSGLDAYSSLKLVRTLQKVAHRGRRTIICTIHQPRADIFSMFDNLLLMVGGRVAYFGATNHVRSYFQSIGQPIPSGINPADFIVDLTHEKDDDFYKRYAKATFDIENQKPRHGGNVTKKASLRSLGPKRASGTKSIIKPILETSHMNENDPLSPAFIAKSQLPPLAAPPTKRFQQKTNPDEGQRQSTLASATSEKDKKSSTVDSSEKGVYEFAKSLDKEFNDETLINQYAASVLQADNNKEIEAMILGHPSAFSSEVVDFDLESKVSNRKYPNSLFTQVLLVTRRSFQNNMRNPGYFVSWIVGVVSFLFYGLIYLGLRTNGSVTRDTLEWWESQRAFLFQIATAIIFLQLESLTAAFLEKQLFYREHASGAYSPFAYHISWFLRISSHGLLRAIVFPPFVYFMSGLTITAGQYFIFVLIFAVLDTIGSSLSLLLVCAVPSLESSSTAFTALTAFIGTGCGFFLRPGLIPAWFIWAYYLSWYKYGLDALYINEFEGEVNAVSGRSVLAEVFEVDSHLTVWGNILVLLSFPVVFNICALVASYLYTKPKKVTVLAK